MYHFVVFVSTPSHTICALTSHHRVRCSSAFKQLAKHHWHVTNTPCKAPKKAVEGATALFVRPSYVTQNTEVRGDKIWHVLSRSPILSHARSYYCSNMKDGVVKCTFLHCLRSNFSPLHPMLLQFEASCVRIQRAFTSSSSQLLGIRLENLQSFNCSRYVLDSLRAMTSHLRAYCNSALKHFAVCAIAHSSIADGSFPAVRLEMIENLNC